MLSSALLVVSHQPHDQTEGLAVRPTGSTSSQIRACLYRSQDAGLVWEKANGRGLPHVAGGALPGHEVQPGAILTVSPQYRDDGGIFYVEQKEGRSVYASRRRRLPRDASSAAWTHRHRLRRATASGRRPCALTAERAGRQLCAASSLIAFSPSFEEDGVLLGGALDLVAPADRGLTWRRVARLEQVARGQVYLRSARMDGCAVCRAVSPYQQFTHGLRRPTSAPTA